MDIRLELAKNFGYLINKAASSLGIVSHFSFAKIMVENK
jgi:hypothetical protein